METLSSCFQHMPSSPRSVTLILSCRYSGGFWPDSEGGAVWMLRTIRWFIFSPCVRVHVFTGILFCRLNFPVWLNKVRFAPEMLQMHVCNVFYMQTNKMWWLSHKHVLLQDFREASSFHFHVWKKANQRKMSSSHVTLFSFHVSNF